MGEWEETALSELADLSGGFAFKSGDYAPSGRFILRTLNIDDDGSINHQDAVFLPAGLCTQYERFELQPEDTLFVMVGATLGKVGFVRKRDLPALLNQNMWLVRARRGRSDPLFLHYAFRLAVRDSLGWASGSARDFVRRDDYRNLSIKAPSLDEQQQIGRILGDLDDKIELNRRMNETLEAMARALFKSWFVDFDPVRAKSEGRDPSLPRAIANLFPNTLISLESGEIPDGWSADTLGMHLRNFDSKRVPLSGSVRDKRPGPFPYHGAADVMDHIDDYIFDGIYLLVGEDGSVTQDGGLAVTQYVWGKIWVNNHAHVLQGRGRVSTEQLYLHFQYEPVAPYVTGAVQPKLSQGRMNGMPFLFAGDGVCSAFAEMIKPIFAKIRANADESRTLASIRDALLPKLISGEIRVKTAAKIVEAIA